MISKVRSPLLFIGHTQSSDVCPTNLAEVAGLGPKSNDVQVLFVTVDSARHTAELAARYVN